MYRRRKEVSIEGYFSKNFPDLPLKDVIVFNNAEKYAYKKDDLEFLEKLGEGQHGEVAKYLHKPTGREVAVKLLGLHYNRIWFNETQAQKIMNEIQIFALLSGSPDIVKMYGWTQISDQVHIFMEPLKMTLKLYLETIKRDRITSGDNKRVMYGTVKALIHCQEKHIRHSDLNLANIFLDVQDTDGYVKLGDFGESYFLYNKEDSACIGTPKYWAPEQFTGESYDADKASVWSVAVIILELAYGENFLMPDIDYEELGELKNSMLKFEKSWPSFSDAEKIDQLSMRYCFAREVFKNFCNREFRS